MSNGAELLRLLEPAVRPVDSSSSKRCEKPPIESRDFESLLAEAQQTETKPVAEPTSEAKPMAAIEQRLLSQLSSVDQIANPDLLALLTRPGATGKQSTRTDSGSFK